MLYNIFLIFFFSQLETGNIVIKIKGENHMTIKEMREKTGLSQNQFAVMVGIPVANIQFWEEGKRKPPEYVLNLLEFFLTKKHFFIGVPKNKINEAVKKHKELKR